MVFVENRSFWIFESVLTSKRQATMNFFFSVFNAFFLFFLSNYFQSSFFNSSFKELHILGSLIWRATLHATEVSVSCGRVPTKTRCDILKLDFSYATVMATC